MSLGRATITPMAEVYGTMRYHGFKGHAHHCKLVGKLKYPQLKLILNLITWLACLFRNENIFYLLSLQARHSQACSIYVFIKTFLNFQYVKEHPPIFLTMEALLRCKSPNGKKKVLVECSPATFPYDFREPLSQTRWTLSQLLSPFPLI